MMQTQQESYGQITITFPCGAATVSLAASSGAHLDILMNAAAERAARIAALGSGHQPAPAGPAQQTQAVAQQQPAPQAQAPAGEPEPQVRNGGQPRPAGPGITCQHGYRRWVSGVSGDGRAYAFWGCTAQQGACKHVYPQQAQ